MADTQIQVDKTQQQGNLAVRLGNLIQEAQNLSTNLLANANVEWDTGVFTTLEARFGLPSGDGNNFLTLLTNVQAALQAATLVEYQSRVANQ